MKWKTCECTGDTPRPGRVGERLRERRALLEITAQAQARGQVNLPPGPSQRTQNTVARAGVEARPAVRAAPPAPIVPPGMGKRARKKRAQAERANAAAASGSGTVTRVTRPRAAVVAGCEVHDWRKLKQSGTCAVCSNFMSQFIVNCRSCGVNVCRACSN